MPEPLTPGPLPSFGGDLQVVSFVGRVGDGLIYRARVDGQDARLREYAPAGIVRRLPNGSLEPTDPAFTVAWEEAAARFLDQGRRLAQLDHYAVAAVRTAAGSDSGIYTIGVPVGQPLSAALAAGLVLPPPLVLRFAADLADALAVLHARGITHLDIAPATVSIAAGWLELADFAVDNRAFVPLLGTQEELVRPGYSPIEQSDASMADPLGPPADIYAASAVLFRLITGRDPPRWEERWRDPAAAVPPHAPDYPPAFLAAVRKGMAIEPSDRFPDGAAWRDALALPPVNQTLREAAEPPAESPTAEPKTGVPARHWLLPLLILAGVLALASLAYLAYTQRWFVSKPRPAATASKNGANAAIPPPPPPANEVPLIQLGRTASGRLEEGDRSRGSGQYEDLYGIDVAANEKVVIRLSSLDFDPLLTLTSPDVTLSNDDAREDTRDSRIVAVIPRGGRFFITVSSYDRGERGAYRLDVLRADDEAAADAPEG